MVGSKVKAALGGTSVTRRVNKKPLPALGRHAYSSSSSDHLRKLLGDNDPQQQQPPQQVAPTTLTGAPAAFSLPHRLCLNSLACQRVCAGHNGQLTQACQPSQRYRRRTRP